MATSCCHHHSGQRPCLGHPGDERRAVGARGARVPTGHQPGPRAPLPGSRRARPARGAPGAVRVHRDHSLPFCGLLRASARLVDGRAGARARNVCGRGSWAVPLTSHKETAFDLGRCTGRYSARTSTLHLPLAAERSAGASVTADVGRSRVGVVAVVVDVVEAPAHAVGDGPSAPRAGDDVAGSVRPTHHLRRCCQRYAVVPA